MTTPHSWLQDACAPDGTLLRREAVDLGIDDNALARLTGPAKPLLRLRQGAYCLRWVHEAATPAQRLRLLCSSVGRQYDDDVAFSHSSACLLQGGPDWGLDLDDVHLTHLQGGGRRGSRIVHHRDVCRVVDLRRQDGRWVVTPARAALEVAISRGPEVGFVQLIYFLHNGLTTVEEVHQQAEMMRCWPGSLVHHALLPLLDARIESVGEARCFLRLHRQGVPMPVPQHEIFDPVTGEFIARVDFAWVVYRVVLEFDGASKYLKWRRPGETAEQAVIREKKREDRLRELGWIVIRVTWSELQDPAQLAARVRRALRMSAPDLYVPARH